MLQKIVFHYCYNVVCMDCGNTVHSDISPGVFDGLSSEFNLDNFTCSSCGNEENFNVTNSEVKRLIVMPDVVINNDKKAPF